MACSSQFLSYHHFSTSDAWTACCNLAQSHQAPSRLHIADESSPITPPAREMDPDMQFPTTIACRLPPELVPEHSLADNTWQVVASDKEAFLQQLHAGRIQPLKGKGVGSGFRI